jgi:hypothetical protein
MKKLKIFDLLDLVVAGLDVAMILCVLIQRIVYHNAPNIFTTIGLISLLAANIIIIAKSILNHRYGLDS